MTVSSPQSPWVSKRPVKKTALGPFFNLSGGLKVSFGENGGQRKQSLLRIAPLSVKLFASLGLCVLGLAYSAFLGQIWVDTAFLPSLIAEGYGNLGTIELVAHSFRYLSWFSVVFAVMTGLFLLTSFAEKLKVFFAVWIPFWIVSDIAAAWLIRVHSVFAFQLFASGFVLAASFLGLFVLIQTDLWFKKPR